jgi:hypothetical protein
LCEWAAAKELHDVARLQAYHILLRDRDHEPSHLLLGHRPAKAGFRWRLGETFVSAADFAAAARERDFELRSEHFVVSGPTGLRTAVDALFDLERLYVAFCTELAPHLRAAEVLEPLVVRVAAGPRKLSKLNATLAYPYCDPTAAGDNVVHTYLDPPMPLPRWLFALGTEQLLYATLVVRKSGPPSTLDERIAPWLEVGLGQWMEARASGSAGYAKFGPPALAQLENGTVLAYRPYGVENLIHLRYMAFHEDARATPYHRANVATFVAFLMDETAEIAGKPQGARGELLEYARQCFAEGKGNSSSLFDQVFSPKAKRIEDLEQPWIAWLSARLGIPAVRRKVLLDTSRSIRARTLGPLR